MTNDEIVAKIADHDKSIEVLFDEVEQNKRKIETFDSIAVSIERLATNMEHMGKEQEKQGQRLERLERAPVEAYKYYKQLIISSIITTIVGGILGAVLTMILR